MSSNLSELSVQLRKLQADKTAQANEIDRLGRKNLWSKFYTNVCMRVVLY